MINKNIIFDLDGLAGVISRLNVNLNGMKSLTVIALCLLLWCCSKAPEKYSDLITRVEAIEDSLSVGDMTIRNAFKYQILAHAKNEFDSLMILKHVYEPNKHAFDNCLGLIFGDENGKMFKPNGIYQWNRDLLKNYDSLISVRLSVLDSLDINNLFTNHLTAVQHITGQKGAGNWMVYFGPKGFQIFGGCDNNSMILDMFGENWNRKSINEVFAHEIEHLIFGPILEADPNGNTGLGITIDEGLAQFFVAKYLNQSLEETFYDGQTKMLLDREREIFDKLEPFFFLNNEDGCPIYRHCGRTNNCEPIIKGLPVEITGNLCYFLGFRIIQKYEETNGANSWKDVYRMPLKEFYEKSGYQQFIWTKKSL
jgi:hypothetical protein